VLSRVNFCVIVATVTVRGMFCVLQSGTVPAEVTSNVDVEAVHSSESPCRWTYQLECDETRSPTVLVVARCQNASDRCETVYADILVERRNSTTGQLSEVNERFAVACRPAREPESDNEAFVPDDYTKN